MSVRVKRALSKLKRLRVVFHEELPDKFWGVTLGRGTVRIALKRHPSGDELIRTLLHELAHELGFEEDRARELERTLFFSPTLRDAAARLLLNKLLNRAKRAAAAGRNGYARRRKKKKK